MFLKDSFMHCLDLVAKADQSIPIKARVSFEAYWLGDLTGRLVFEVEVKDQNGELGWLYSDVRMVAFTLNGLQYAAKTKDLRSLAEEKLKGKIFIDVFDAPQHNR